MRIFHLIVCAFCLFLLNSFAAAADQNNMFSVKGIGSTTCEQFNHAFKLKNKKLDMYGGWVEGYITALNQASGETFDLSPWQSTDLLVTAIAKYCRKSPEKKFFDIVQSMVVSLQKDRLDAYSSIEEIRRDNKVLLMYQDIIKRTQQTLIKLGFFTGDADGKYGGATEAAVRQFQKSVDLSATGIPDQRTLVLLFQK